MLQGQETYLLKIRVYAVLKFSFSRFKKAAGSQYTVLNISKIYLK